MFTLWINRWTGTAWLVRLSDNVVIRGFVGEVAARDWCERERVTLA